MKGTFYRKRMFLNPVSTGQTSYLLAEVESTRGGEYKWGHNMLTIADCRRRVQLEFFIGTKKARQQSLDKISLMVTHLVRFASALKREIELVNAYEQKEKESTKRKDNGRTKKARKGQARKRSSGNA